MKKNRYQVDHRHTKNSRRHTRSFFIRGNGKIQLQGGAGGLAVKSVDMVLLICALSVGGQTGQFDI